MARVDEFEERQPLRSLDEEVLAAIQWAQLRDLNEQANSLEAERIIDEVREEHRDRLLRATAAGIKFLAVMRPLDHPERAERFFRPAPRPGFIGFLFPGPRGPTPPIGWRLAAEYRLQGPAHVFNGWVVLLHNGEWWRAGTYGPDSIGAQKYGEGSYLISPLRLYDLDAWNSYSAVAGPGESESAAPPSIADAVIKTIGVQLNKHDVVWPV